MDFFMSCVCGCLNCGDLKTSMAFGNFQEAGTRLTFGDAVIGMMLALSRKKHPSPSISCMANTANYACFA
ncbi:unnamed protein product [Amoebophrya sp. A120]|nr:unnamed protein product [Amoebophrya sp. A120]|eukprot:GSA120T00022202001.1